MTISVTSNRQTELDGDGEENNPFVAWENWLADATLDGGSVETGGAASNAVNGNTSSFWLPTIGGAGTANFAAQFSASRVVSFAAIAAHNLSDFGGSVRVQNSSDGGSSWSAVSDLVTPTDNSPILFRMDTSGTSQPDWRFRFSGLTSGDALAVGVAVMGYDLIIPQRMYQGYSPVITPTEVELQSNVSIGGNLLGSSVVKRGSRLQAELTYIPATFIRGADWIDFQSHFNDGGGAFFGWRPDKYPQDGHYIWRDGSVIRPTNSGPRDRMSFNIEARVYEG